MAKRQSNAGVFERAGYALAASELTMKHHDYVKSLKEDISFKAAENKDKESKGLLVDGEKMGVNVTKDSTDYIVSLAEQEKALGAIKVGGKYEMEDGTTGTYTEEDVRNAGDQIDQVRIRIQNHNKHVEAKYDLSVETYNRGISKSATAEQLKNYTLLIGQHYGDDGLKQKLDTNPESKNYGEYLYYDYTVGDHVPLSQFNTGNGYDNTLAESIEGDKANIIDFANKPATLKDRGLWERQEKPKILNKVNNIIKENPKAITDLLFEEDDFQPLLNTMLKDLYFPKPTDTDLTEAEKKFYQQMDIYGFTEEENAEDLIFQSWKQSDLYNTAMEQMKMMSINPEYFIKSYEEMIDGIFNEASPEVESEENLMVVE